jgi:hypothetical protein
MRFIIARMKGTIMANNPLFTTAQSELRQSGAQALSTNFGTPTTPFANWCAQYVNSVLSATGFPTLTSGNVNVATAYTNWGTAESPGTVQQGDILVNTRGLATGELGGHVGIATGGFDANGNPLGIASSSSGGDVELEELPDFFNSCASPTG